MEWLSYLEHKVHAKACLVYWCTNVRARAWFLWTDRPSSWFAEVVVRLNCCSRYFPRKAAKPATTAISIQAARMMQVNTGFERRCLVTLGITSCKKQNKTKQKQRMTINILACWLAAQTRFSCCLYSSFGTWLHLFGDQITHLMNHFSKEWLLLQVYYEN